MKFVLLYRGAFREYVASGGGIMNLPWPYLGFPLSPDFFDGLGSDSGVEIVIVVLVIKKGNKLKCARHLVTIIFF